MTDVPQTDSTPQAFRVPSPIAALAAWLVPGLGYVLMGERSRGITVGVTIILLFWLGLFISGMKIVDPFTSYTIQGILQKPAYMGQILTGPMAIICARVAADPSFATSHSRANEIGTLYTAVAGMLNLLVIIDVSFRASTPREAK
ncbi:MAG: DUF6677 family protein [Tepidisphaerales bacterium]